MEPSAPKHMRRFLGLSPITLHDAVAPGNHMTHRTAVRRHIASVRIDYANLRPRNRKPRHRLTRLPLRIARLDPRLDGREGQHGRSLRQPVTGNARASKRLFKFANESRRRSRSAKNYTPQAAQVILRPLGRIHQSDSHGRHQATGLHALPLDQPEHIRRIELMDHHVSSAGKRYVMRLAPPVGVKQRDGMHLHRVTGHLQRNHGIQCVQIDIAMT